MNRQIIVTYTPEIIARSLRMQWLALIGPSGIAALILLSGLFAYFWVTGERDWVFGVSLACLVIFCAVVIFGYFRLRKLSMSKFQKMGKPTAEFTFSDDSISITADTGRLDLAWKMIDKVLRSSDVWVLASQGGGITLPVGALDDELRIFILKQVNRKK